MFSRWKLYFNHMFRKIKIVILYFELWNSKLPPFKFIQSFHEPVLKFNCSKSDSGQIKNDLFLLKNILKKMAIFWFYVANTRYEIWQIWSFCCQIWSKYYLGTFLSVWLRGSCYQNSTFIRFALKSYFMAIFGNDFSKASIL